MNKIIKFVLSVILAAAGLISCTRVWHDPNTSVPHKETSIVEILVTPSAYDNAGVEIEGRVWDLYSESDTKNGNTEPYSLFKLADKDGNYLHVRSSSNLPPVIEGEIIRVVGVHRLIRNPQTNEIRNEIEAYSIEKN